jgi:hypothetical protein
MAVNIYYYQYNLYMYDLCMSICYLRSITQVLKDTLFGQDNWCECGNLLLLLFDNIGIEYRCYSILKSELKT